MGILPFSQNAYTTSFPGQMSLHLFTCLEQLLQGKRVVDHLEADHPQRGNAVLGDPRPHADTDGFDHGGECLC